MSKEQRVSSHPNGYHPIYGKDHPSEYHSDTGSGVRYYHNSAELRQHDLSYRED